MVCGKQRCVLQEIQNFFVSPFFFVFFCFFFLFTFCSVLSCLVLSCLLGWEGWECCFLSVSYFVLFVVRVLQNIHTHIY